jgi:hypothetical protein
MAPRKRSSAPNVGAWLGGNKGYVLSGSNTDTSAKADAGGGQAEAVRGELGLGAYTAGIGATAAIGAGIAAARSPVGRRAARAVTGRKTSYFVHGSPTQNIKKLDPKYETMPDKLVSDPPFEDRWPEGVDPSHAGIYGWPITKASGEKGSSNILNPRADMVNQIKDSYDYAQGSGSLYIAKAPRSKVGWDSDEIISAPSRVIKEISVRGKTADQVVREAEKALKRLGFKYPKKK